MSQRRPSQGRQAFRATVKDPANKLFPPFGCREERFHVSLTLAGPGKENRRAVLEHGRKVSAIDAQAMGRTPDIRIEAKERGAAVVVGETLAKVFRKVDAS